MPSSLVEIVAFAKSQGLLYVKCGDIEVRLPPPVTQPPITADSKIPSEGLPSDTDFLFWSAPENTFEEPKEE
jgi:hypothetical protein